MLDITDINTHTANCPLAARDKRVWHLSFVMIMSFAYPGSFRSSHFPSSSQHQCFLSSLMQMALSDLPSPGFFLALVQSVLFMLSSCSNALSDSQKTFSVQPCIIKMIKVLFR
jgi:hypothetical protein